MADPNSTDPATVSSANDKLLKALITLLALRDRALLDELRTIFAVARRDGNPIGFASDPTWAHIRQDLELITQLVDSDDEASEFEGDLFRQSATGH